MTFMLLPEIFQEKVPPPEWLRVSGRALSTVTAASAGETVWDIRRSATTAATQRRAAVRIFAQAASLGFRFRYLARAIAAAAIRTSPHTGSQYTPLITPQRSVNINATPHMASRSLRLIFFIVNDSLYSIQFITTRVVNPGLGALVSSPPDALYER